MFFLSVMTKKKRKKRKKRKRRREIRSSRVIVKAQVPKLKAFMKENKRPKGENKTEGSVNQIGIRHVAKRLKTPHGHAQEGRKRAGLINGGGGEGVGGEERGGGRKTRRRDRKT